MIRSFWLIPALLFATAVVVLLFSSRFSRGPAATVMGILLLFILAVPAAVFVVVALVLKICRRFNFSAAGAPSKIRGIR